MVRASHAILLLQDLCRLFEPKSLKLGLLIYFGRLSGYYFDRMEGSSVFGMIGGWLITDVCLGTVMGLALLDNSGRKHQSFFVALVVVPIGVDT